MRLPLTNAERLRLLAWAAKAQKMSGQAYDRGDWISARSHLETAARYRRMVYGDKHR